MKRVAIVKSLDYDISTNKVCFFVSSDFSIIDNRLIRYKKVKNNLREVANFYFPDGSTQEVVMDSYRINCEL